MFGQAPALLWLLASLAGVQQTTAVQPPGCQITPPDQTTLTNVKTTFLDVPASPFGIVYSKRPGSAFVVLGNTVGVLNTSTFDTSLSHQIQLPAAYVTGGAEGAKMSKDGKYLFVAADTGAIVIDTEKALDNSSDAVLGYLNGTAGIGAIQISSEGDYAFVSVEYGLPRGSVGPGSIEVFKLNGDKQMFTSKYIGSLALGSAVVGSALSPDGKLLYVTSEGYGSEAHTAANQTFASDDYGNATTSVKAYALIGILSVIDVKELIKNPSKALITNTVAGCNPVRVIVSSNSKHVWVAARESNHILAFDAHKLKSNQTSNDSLVASVQVGQSPIDLIFVKNETRVLTADSNRFYNNHTSGISVIDVQAALRGQDAMIGRINAGVAVTSFPREFAKVVGQGNVLVSNFESHQIETIDIATIP